MEEREYQDSYTVGTPAKGGALKVYFDIDEESKKNIKDTKAYKLHQLKIALQKEGYMNG